MEERESSLKPRNMSVPYAGIYEYIASNEISVVYINTSAFLPKFIHTYAGMCFARRIIRVNDGAGS